MPCARPVELDSALVCPGEPVISEVCGLTVDLLRSEALADGEGDIVRGGLPVLGKPVAAHRLWGGRYGRWFANGLYEGRFIFLSIIFNYLRKVCYYPREGRNVVTLCYVIRYVFGGVTRYVTRYGLSRLPGTIAGLTLGICRALRADFVGLRDLGDVLNGQALGGK